MIPGINPRQMRQAMKKMGIQQEELDAKLVRIVLDDREIVISNPSIQKVNMMGQWSYQISGDEEVLSLDTAPEINEDDVQTVMSQANVSEDVARKAIEDANGDLAQAILDLSSSD